MAEGGESWAEGGEEVADFVGQVLLAGGAVQLAADGQAGEGGEEAVVAERALDPDGVFLAGWG